MLTQIEVRNFQSLASADVPLGLFTVLLGESDAGKSAFIRAVRLLAFNASGTGYVRTGQQTCSVTAGGPDWVARITRSSRRGGPNQYQVARLAEDGKTWAPVKYTKLNKQVPGPVTELLALSELNFAAQWDAPYLLALPGTELARTLGELTNVSLVLNAAASANRVRKRLDRELADARARRDGLLEEVQQYAGLAARREAASAAERALERHQAALGRRDRLRALLGRLTAAEAAFRAAETEAARQAPPSLGRLEELAARLGRLRELRDGVIGTEREITLADGEVKRAAAAEVTAEAELHTALAAAGQCPVCGSVIR